MPIDLTTKSRIAKHAGISVDAVSKWNLTPVKKAGKINYYYQGDVYEKLLSMGKNKPTSEKRNFDYERTRKEKEMTDKLEMENELTRGNQVLVSDVKDAIIEFVTLCKNKLLGIRVRINKIIVKQAGVRLSITNQKKIEKGVDEEVRKALEELAGLSTENIQQRSR